MSYQQFLLKLTPSQSTNSLNLVVPATGESVLIQALRMNVQAPSPVPGGGEREAVLKLEANGIAAQEIGKIPVPQSLDPIVIDVMPYISNLAAYGIASPDKLKINMSVSLDLTDSITFWGFGVTGGVA